MYNIVAILPMGQGIGFSMVGVKVHEVGDLKEAQRTLASELGEEGNGIILIDESLLTDITPKIKRQIEESARPLVVGLPIITHWEAVRSKDEIISDIIQRAVGYRIGFSETG